MTRDLHLVHGEDFMVMNYMFIVEALDKDGKSQTLYSHGNDTTFSTMLGWIAFVKLLITERVRRGLNREED
jgi:hypothetical protein